MEAERERERENQKRNEIEKEGRKESNDGRKKEGLSNKETQEIYHERTNEKALKSR